MTHFVREILPFSFSSEEKKQKFNCSVQIQQKKNILSSFSIREKKFETDQIHGDGFFSSFYHRIDRKKLTNKISFRTEVTERRPSLLAEDGPIAISDKSG